MHKKLRQRSCTKFKSCSTWHHHMVQSSSSLSSLAYLHQAMPIACIKHTSLHSFRTFLAISNPSVLSLNTAMTIIFQEYATKICTSVKFECTKLGMVWRRLTAKQDNRYFIGCEILKLATWPWPRPLRGQLVTRKLVLLVAKPCTKFGIYSFSRSEGISWGVKF